ncbi:hypothetical protein BDW71DRAFT_193933 [Aspergillus fruticulosus]
MESDHDLDDEVDNQNPAIRAAGNPNSAVLEKSLLRIQQKEITRSSPSAAMALFGQFRSPIKAAISINSVENVRLLLTARADPSGICRWEAADYSVRYVRGRDYQDNFNSHASCERHSIIVANAGKRGIVYSICPLTEAELDERRQWFPVFWPEPIIPGRSLRIMRASTALEDAAGWADESVWLQSQESNNPDLWNFGKNAPVSVLPTSSPVHEALTQGHHMMLRHLLLTCGCLPNYRPRAVPTMALPPLSPILVRCYLNYKHIQICLVDLLTHPQLGILICAPPSLLLTWLAGFISGGLAAAGTTSLGHTLLHVASLPLDASQSLRKTQTLPNPFHRISVMAGQMASQNPQPLTLPQQKNAASYHPREEGFNIDVKAKDVDGNTALRYLAGTLNMAEETFGLETKNRWGLTPSQPWGE